MTPLSHNDRPAHVVQRSLRRTLWAAVAITSVFFVGLGTWASQAPLAGAVVASAVTSPDGKRRQIQHLEGGIVRQLLVREGGFVNAGDPLIILDSTSAKASRDILGKELRSLLALKARLIAERDGISTIAFPHELLEDHSEEAKTLLATQRALFQTRRKARLQRKMILERQLSQLEETIVGTDARISSQDEQLRLLQEESKGVMTLVREGLERRPRLLSLQRAEAELMGARATAQATAAGTAQAMSETVAEIGAIDTQHMEEVGSKLADVEAELPAVREKLRAASEVVDRTVISAPVTGTIVELEANTIGGVVGAGRTILEIVPRDEEILFDVRISPTDVDAVVAGLPARIILTGYSLRTTRPLEGTVRQVSADRIVDPKTNQPYYLARVELPAANFQALPPEITLKPGMPAEVMVMTSERTVLDYLIEPLIASFRKSFREG